jgi:hypothetical protein
VFGEAGPEAIMPLTRGADGSLGVRAIGRQSPAVQDAARQIEAQPRIAISISAPNTFTGKPDDATLLAFDQRNAALKRQLINELTAEVHNPQKQFGRAIYSNLQPKNHDKNDYGTPHHGGVTDQLRCSMLKKKLWSLPLSVQQNCRGMSLTARTSW